MAITHKSKSLTYDKTNDLESHVAEWLNEKAGEYDEGLEGVFKDLFYGGCQSGYVPHLIYSADCRDFVVNHMLSIQELMNELVEQFGAECIGSILFKDHFSFDRLAWLAFEETARKLAQEH